MTVTQVGTTQKAVTTTSAGTVSFTIPNSGGSPALADDIMLVAIALTSSTQTVTTPTNWTKALDSNVASACHMYLLWKPVTASDLTAGAITFTYSGFTNEAVEFMIVRGADTVAPVTVGSVVSSGTFIATYVIPSVAGINGGLLTMVFACEGSSNTGGGAAPAGMAPSSPMDESTGNFMGMALTYQALASTAATGTRTLSIGSRAGQGVLVAFNPIVVPAPPTLPDTVQDFRQRGGVVQLGKFTRLGK